MKLLYLLVLLNFSFASYSHEGARAANKIKESLKVGEGVTTGGYGNIPPEESGLDMISEASASYDPVFTCPTDFEKCYQSIEPVSLEVNGMASEFIKRQLTKLAREKLFEYSLSGLSVNDLFNEEMRAAVPSKVIDENEYSFNMKDFQKKYSADLKCIKDSSLYKRVNGVARDGYTGEFDVARNEDDPTILYTNNAPNGEYDQNQYNKVSALSDAVNLNKILKVFSWYKHLQEKQKQFDLDNLTERGLDMQLSVTEQMNRIRQTYPSIFPENVSEQNKIHNNLSEIIYQSLYLRTIDFKKQPRKRISRNVAITNGKKEFLRVMRNPLKITEVIDNLSSGLESLEAGAKLNNSFCNVFTSEIKSAQKEVLKIDKTNKLKSMKELCQTSFEQIAEKHPQVIRQMIIDSKDPKVKKMFRLELCKGRKGFLQKDWRDSFRRDSVCSRQGGKDRKSRLRKGEQVSIRSASVFYPFNDSEQNLGFQQSPDKTLTISRNILINPGDLSDAKKECLRNKIKSEFESDINCQVGSVDVGEMSVHPNTGSLCGTETTQKVKRVCPTPPHKPRKNKVKLKLNIYFEGETLPDGVQITRGDKMNIHNCYNADLPYNDRSNCQKVKELHYGRCVEKKGNYKGGDCNKYLSPNANKLSRPKLTKCCKENINKAFDANPSSLMRANSANLTSDSKLGTWKHEILHKFGLRDEYSDPNYPVSPLGGYNNIMNQHKDDGAIIRPYQLDWIIGNLECI